MMPRRPFVGPELAHWVAEVCADRGLPGASALVKVAAHWWRQTVARLIADALDHMFGLIGATS